MTTPQRLAAAAVAGALTLTLTACAGGAPESPPAASVGAPTTQTSPADGHNAADAEFAQMMIVHHQGAIEMAELAIANAATDEVRALGERIAAAQGPEIDLMSGWLDTWGEAQPSDADMGGMGHEGMDMEGMDQQEVMDELSGLSGTEFDKRFLELMVDHHRGAIEMAETARDEGLNADVVHLAGKIIDDQTAEITEMENLARSL